MLPQVCFGQYQISRLICGSNPFLGYSYRSPAHDAWQRRTFTPDRVAEVLAVCLEHGINAVTGNWDDNATVGQALEVCEHKVGKRPSWIAYTYGGPEGQVDCINRIADYGAIACFIQGGTVDRSFTYDLFGGLDLSQPDRCDQVIPWLEEIRKRGMIPGLGTHRPPILHLAEERGYGAEFYVTTLNFAGIYCDYADAVRAIHSIQKPFIAIKTLGGGCVVKPRDGLTCAYASLKRTDLVALGMENEEIVEYNAKLAADIIACLAL